MINEASVGYNEKSDVWALGCLIFELCALTPPFNASNHLSLAVKINAGKFSRVPAQYRCVWGGGSPPARTSNLPVSANA